MNSITKLPKQDVEKTLQLHTEYESLGMVDEWAEGNKEFNFREMLKLIDLTGRPLEGTACLDVGCGQGDLSFWLRERGVKRYLGIDVYERALQIARSKYPHEEFIKGEFLATPFQEVFDYVFCSGALTIKVSVGNYAFLRSALEKMWNQSRIGVVFNILTDDDLYPDPDLFFYSVDQVREICKELAPEAKIATKKTPHVSQSHVYLYRPQV